MNTASLELCRELYELSGWGEDGNQPDAWHDISTPAYDLGYLLRKLPGRTSIIKLIDNYIAIHDEPSQIFNADFGYKFVADTPEDAAAGLAIELLKTGVLQKEQS